MERKNWTREELILAFNLYCKIPFGSFHNRNPKVIELANLIGRTSNAVALKLSNFASFDPHHQKRGVKGMQNSGKLDKEIWDEFTNNWDDLIFKSEEILAEKQKTTIEKKYKINLNDTKNKIGDFKIREVKTRVNQDFFRKLILSIYDSKCAITGMNITEMLIASHIIPWSDNEKERLNPANGICLSPLYDKAFDKGFIAIDKEYKILISSDLKKNLKKITMKIFLANTNNKA